MALQLLETTACGWIRTGFVIFASENSVGGDQPSGQWWARHSKIPKLGRSLSGTPLTGYSNLWNSERDRIVASDCHKQRFTDTNKIITTKTVKYKT